MGSSALPREAWLLAIAGLPGMGPVRLDRLLAGREPEEVWAFLQQASTDEVARCSGCGPKVAAQWRCEAKQIDVAEVWSRAMQQRFGLHARGSGSYPAPLAHDPEPPMLLHSAGDPTVGSAGPTVGVVGTRRCTRYGHDIAYELGFALADAGVHVVSGLALGIDAAAHQGALDASGAAPVGVVGSGLDVPYPRRNEALWHEVAEIGVLWSESPPGTKPEPWRFPARNRIIAALSDVLVVVESAERGGSLLTVDEMDTRDKLTMAVPGSIRSAVSIGTNRLLQIGKTAVLSPGDVLAAVEIVSAARRPADGRRSPTEAEVETLDAFCWQPLSLDELAERRGGAFGDLLAMVDDLEAAGWLARRGGWIERVAIDDR